MFVLVCLVLFMGSSCMSMDKMIGLFNCTYDVNGDGESDIGEFAQYYTWLQHGEKVSEGELEAVFSMYDVNDDGKVHLQEFLAFVRMSLPNYQAGHKQIHIALTGDPTKMHVTWVSNPQTYDRPVVKLGKYPTHLNMTVSADRSTYNVGHLGFHGQIYKATLSELLPSTTYFYKVGDTQTDTYSSLKSFTTAPPNNSTLGVIKFITFGDMGTYAPMGFEVSHALGNEILIDNYAFVWLTGDMAYAGMNSQEVGQTEPIWDVFGELTEKFAAWVPFMTGMGNHESYYNFTSYNHRYTLPKQQSSQPNFWFSFDYAQLHILYFSSEHQYGEGSEQYKFLEEDLRKARENENTKWILMGCHRPMYSSSSRQHDPTSLRTALEGLVEKYKVDIFQTGHEHSYERIYPTGDTTDHYYNPEHPVYVVQGTAGGLIRNNWKETQPSWSIKRELKYGYGRITIQYNTLKYEYISVPENKIMDSWYIHK